MYNVWLPAGRTRLPGPGVRVATAPTVADDAGKLRLQTCPTTVQGYSSTKFADFFAPYAFIEPI